MMPVCRVLSSEISTISSLFETRSGHPITKKGLEIFQIRENPYNFKHTSLNSSHDFLSAIFGIFGKFGIGIGDQKR